MGVPWYSVRVFGGSTGVRGEEREEKRRGGGRGEWIDGFGFGFGWVDGWMGGFNGVSRRLLSVPPVHIYIYIFHTYVARPGSLFEYLTPSNAADSHLVLALLPATRSPLLTPLSLSLRPRHCPQPRTALIALPPLPMPCLHPPLPPSSYPGAYTSPLNSFNEMQKATKTMAQTYVSPLSLGSYV